MHHDGKTRFVTQGDCEITDDTRLRFQTVLGSCISLCARCPQSGVGGMNHFLLPADPSGDVAGESQRFGVYAVEALINTIIARTGADRKQLELKAFGGGSVAAGMTNVGKANITFLESVLQRDRLVLAASDLGGEFGRKLIYHPATGKAWIKRLSVVDERQVAVDEFARLSRRERKPEPQDDIELFG